MAVTGMPPGQEGMPVILYIYNDRAAGHKIFIVWPEVSGVLPAPISVSLVPMHYPVRPIDVTQYFWVCKKKTVLLLIHVYYC